MKLFNAKKSAEEQMEEEIRSIVEEGQEQGFIEENEAELITNIFEFNDKEAKDIMTSRQNLVGIPHDTKISDAIKLVMDNKFSRLPIYEEDWDNILGVVHLKDIVEKYFEDPEAMVTDVMEEPFFIHPTLGISKLLSQMQRLKTHMAIIIDEYGQTEGIVCMEDIIEEIVGNIYDEHDDEHYDSDDSDIKKISDSKFIVKAMTRLEEVSEALDTEFEAPDIETLNGFLLYKLGRLPKPDEPIEIIYGGYKYVPLKHDDKMISLVEVTKLPKEEEE